MTAKDINRLVSTARDFDVSGLSIIAYYLRLYAVEQVLSERERTPSMTELATELLDNIEGFKNSVNSSEEGDEQAALRTLVDNQDKARIYVLNFAMSLYNSNLLQLKEGAWNIDLRKGLRCCIDLLNCVLHLWKDQVEDEPTLRKRIKYCKVYLAKVMKGEINNVGDMGSEISESLTVDTSVSNNSELSERGFPPEQEDINLHYEPPKEDLTLVTPADKDIQQLLEQARALQQSAEEDIVSAEKNIEQVTIEDHQDAKSEEFKEASTMPPSPRMDVEPTFIDPDVPTTNETIRQDETASSGKKTTYSTQDLYQMMDKSAKIEQIQKLAKYAISALNYEDVPTAKDELLKAIELLETLE